MITYKKYPFGLTLLLRLYGSAVLRTSIFGLLAALQSILLYSFVTEERRQDFYIPGSPYLTIPALVATTSLLIVFRQQSAYGRFHEGRVQLQTMTASFCNVCALAFSFDAENDENENDDGNGEGAEADSFSHPLPHKEENEEEKQKPQNLTSTSTNRQTSTAGPTAATEINATAKLAANRKRFRSDLVHVISLLHATCLQYLRCDWDLDNLTIHDEAQLPVWDSANAPDFSVRWMHYVMPPWDRIAARRRWNAVSKLPVIGGISWIEKKSLKYGTLTRLNTFTQTASISLASMAMPQDGGGVATSTLRGGDARPGGSFVVCLDGSDAAKHMHDGAEKKSFASSSLRRKSNVSQNPSSPAPPHQQANSFGSISRNLNSVQRVRRFFQRLWTSETAQVVRGAGERPYCLIHAVSCRLRRRMKEDGGLDTPPPILATLWQQLSAGVQAFEQCRYLQDTPFPFTWSQIIVILLLVWQVIFPLTVVVAYKDRALGVAVSTVTVWTLWAINESSREVEDPYVCEPNDLPLARLQYMFNQRLLALAAAAAAQSSSNDFFVADVAAAVATASGGRGSARVSVDEEPDAVHFGSNQGGDAARVDEHMKYEGGVDILGVSDVHGV